MHNIVTGLCRTIPDYPEPGINFYDLNSVFASPAFHVMTENLARRLERDTDIQYPTHIVGVESRGFVLGSAIAQEMMLPFVMIRKENSKYPGETKKQSYELEYGTNTLELQEGILGHTSRVIIVDDLVATGGSLLAAQTLCENTGATVLANTAMLNLRYIKTKEKDKLKNLIVIENVYPLVDQLKEDSLDKHGWE